MNRKLSVLMIVALVSSGIGATALAHDTDIYINNTSGSGAEPLVMFTLDLRSNTGSTFCPASNTNCDFLYDNDPNTAGVQGDPLNGGQVYLTTRPTTQMDVLRAVIKYVVNRVSGVKVGLMLNHDDNCTGSGLKAGPTKTGCSNGAYVFYGFNSLSDKATLFTKLNAIPNTGGTTSHAFQGRELYFELFRYLTGQQVWNGRLGYKDYGNNTSTGNLDTDSPSLSWDINVIDNTTGKYRSPLTNADACTKIYAINFLFQVSQKESESDDAIDDPKSLGGLGVNPSSVYSYNPDNSFSPIVRWMYENDLADGSFVSTLNKDGKQNVTSYFIIPGNVTNTTRNYASAGQGVNGTSLSPYQFSDDPSALVSTLKSIFQQILSVSTTFTAPSVAVNVYNRSQVLSDVYIAMFIAEKNGKPLWDGNIKKFNIDAGVLEDVNGTPAVAGDGRIEHTALSYWTNAATLPAPNPSLSEVAGKDGRSVARGGCGQRVPGFVSGTPGLTNAATTTTATSNRRLFTEPASYSNGSSTSLMAIEATTSTADALFSPTNYFGAATTTVGTCDATDTDTNSACNLIKYARGLADDGTTKRAWLVADPLHSKPLAINYGAVNGHSTSNPDVRIVMGTNDGFVRMIRNTASDGTQDGTEAWAFMPREAMKQLSKLKANIPTSPPEHPISMDGSAAAYVYDANQDGDIKSGDKVYVYMGMRRGGNSYYALDLSNPNDPKILWKITKGGTDFAELGETWSTPRVARMIVDGSNTPTPVLIFGGGYDPNKDTHPPHVASRQVGTNDTKGNAIFIVNAETGALIWKAAKGTLGYDSGSKAYRHPNLDDSIPSDVTPVDSDGNGLIDRLYVGDTGGRIWRVDMKCSDPDGVNLDASNNPTPGCGTSTSPKPWKVTLVLSVGRHESATRADDRRFFYAPDYVQTSDGSGNNFDAIIIGSGDREDPKSTDTVDYFYMFKDKDTVTGQLSHNTGTPYTHAQLGDITNCTPATPCTSSPPDLTYGWKLKLECPSTDPAYRTPCGEKNLAPAQTLGGATFFTTYIPAGTTSTCELAEGNGALYAVAVQDGAPVGFAATSGDLGKADRISKLQSGGIPAEIVQLGDGQYLRPDLITGTRRIPAGIKTFWYKKHVK